MGVSLIYEYFYGMYFERRFRMFAWKKKKAAESEVPAAEVPEETFRIPRGALI